MTGSATATGGGIELWLADLERSRAVLEAFAQATGCLADDDLERVAAAGDAAARVLRRDAYTALRWVLERRLGSCVRGIAFQRSAEGKPRLAGQPVSFSLSHVGHYALIGATAEGEIGVDLEMERAALLANRHRQAIIEAAQGLGGGQWSESLSSTEARFLQAWCRLEAFSKARGSGIAVVMTELGVRGPRAREQQAPGAIAAHAGEAVHRAGFVVSDLTLPADLYGAVAAIARPATTSPRFFPTDWPSLIAGLGQSAPAL